MKYINQDGRSRHEYKRLEFYIYTGLLREIWSHATHVCGVRAHTHTHTHTHTPAKAVFPVVTTIYTFIHNRCEEFVILHFSILCVAILRLHDEEISWVTTIQIFLELFYLLFIFLPIYSHSLYSNLAYDKLNWHSLFLSRLTEGRRHWK